MPIAATAALDLDVAASARTQQKGCNLICCHVRRLLVDCNQLAVEIDAEIAVIHNWVRDQYRPKFPELESLVHHPIDYARVVKAIGNEVRVPAACHCAAYGAFRVGQVPALRLQGMLRSADALCLEQR